MISAAIFDFDYTLADSSAGIVLCITQIFTNMGLAVPQPDAIKQIVGMQLSDLFIELSDSTSSELFSTFAKKYKVLSDKIMNSNTIFFENVPAVISNLKRRGMNIGIVSTKYHYRIEEFIQQKGVSDCFDVIIGGEDVKIHKPHPEGLLKAIDFFNVQKDSVLYIGDSVIDADTAQRAGVRFVASLTGVTVKSAFAPYPVYRYIDDISEIKEFIWEK